MAAQFNINFSCTSREKRPPVSYKIREYYSSYLEQHLFNQAGIIVNGSWNIHLSIMFVEEGPRFTSSDIFLAAGAKVVKSEKVKLYEMVVPLKIVLKDGDVLNNTIEALQNALTVFFTATYKKVTKEKMDELWKNVDKDYLRSLPFPAPIQEQKYVGDMVRGDGSVYFYE